MDLKSFGVVLGGLGAVAGLSWLRSGHGRSLAERARITVVPPPQPGVEGIYGRLRTVDGYKVVEVDPRYYASEDLRSKAERFFRSEGAPFSGWIVSDMYGRDASDPIPNRSTALQILVERSRGSRG